MVAIKEINHLMQDAVKKVDLIEDQVKQKPKESNKYKYIYKCIFFF